MTGSRSPPMGTSRNERRDDTVPPEAVVPPPESAHPHRLRPEHLYKAVGLFFLFALVYNYLAQFAQTFLLAYAAIILAVLLNAIIRQLPVERRWMAGLLGLLIVVATGVILWLGVPVLLSQVRNLATRIPEASELVREIEAGIHGVTGVRVQLLGPEASQFFQNALLGSLGGTNIVARLQGLLGWLLVPLLILFGGLFAAGRPNDHLLSPVLRVVPRDMRLAVRRIIQLLGERLLGWLKGVLVSMTMVGMLSFVAYYFIGVPNAFLLAIFAGLTEAIPIIGPWIGGGAATFVALLDDPTKAMWTALAALAIQQIEGNLILPFAMARTADVHPFITLFAVVLFGLLFGFLGVLLAIPIVLLIWTLMEVLWVERALDTDQDPIAPVVRE